jgi:hypothetical protein
MAQRYAGSSLTIALFMYAPRIDEPEMGTLILVRIGSQQSIFDVKLNSKSKTAYRKETVTCYEKIFFQIHKLLRMFLDVFRHV